MLGATTAFCVFNALAVLFGSLVVALLFGGFGVHALLRRPEAAPENVRENPSVRIFFATLLVDEK